MRDKILAVMPKVYYILYLHSIRIIQKMNLRNIILASAHFKILDTVKLVRLKLSRSLRHCIRYIKGEETMTWEKRRLSRFSIHRVNDFSLFFYNIDMFNYTLLNGWTMDIRMEIALYCQMTIFKHDECKEFYRTLQF